MFQCIKEIGFLKPLPTHGKCVEDIRNALTKLFGLRRLDSPCLLSP